MKGMWTWVRATVLGLLLLAGTAVATGQDTTAPEAGWQEAITGQVEAFRAKDAPGAFLYASTPFHDRFESAEQFFLAIVGSGYTPIIDSRSHSFGAFTVLEDKSVLQEVRFVGNDQALYGALYQLTEETDGWRVMGVQLMKQPGMGI